jgi:2-polyprenyl-3-methyl-5-hydroxy-6-metoxy-1,4-benzoquinol methylase
VKGRILLFPVITQGAGSGHLKRCLSLLEEGEQVYCYLPRESGEGERTGSQRTIDDLLRLIEGPNRDKCITELQDSSCWDWIVFDRKATSTAELFSLLTYGNCLGLDEGGPAREYCTYTLDTLPALKRESEPNYRCLGFLDLPEKRRTASHPPQNILLTFGGEDSAGLTARVARFLLKNSIVSPEQLTVVTGPFFRGELDLPGQVRILEAPAQLKSILGEYDLVITAFGLTCFEAIASGAAVLLVNPTAYHSALSKETGIPEIGRSHLSRRRCTKLMSRLPEIREQEYALIPQERLSLIHYISRLEPPQQRTCPVCGSNHGRAVARFRERSFFRCSICTIIYQLSFAPSTVRYDRDYFFKEYARQYGRTYLEDFSHIQELARQRLKALDSLMRRRQAGSAGSSDPRLLDIGCAYGPFLAEASAQGYAVFGIDVCEDAVRYVANHLSIPAAVSTFEAFDASTVSKQHHRFDVLTMWFVIEHLQDLQSALRKVNSLLVPGGLFCFSTPNSNGASGRRGLRGFLRESPQDHVTVWSPTAARTIMKRYGFTVRKVRITGHHPERLPFVRKKSGVFFRVAALLSRLLGLGDTFEVYAVKESEV